VPGTESTVTAQKSARRLAMEEARRSKRPSRSDRPAGTTPTPDRVLDDAGFPRLLQRVLTSARSAPDTAGMIEVLLTLDGHLDLEHARRSLTRAEVAAVQMLTRTGRPPGPGEPGGPGKPGEAGQSAVFTSAVALSPQGRMVVTVPTRRALPPEAAATGVAARISWSEEDLAEYRVLLADVEQRTTQEIHECRIFLEAMGSEGRTAAVDAIRGAVFLVPPVMFYKGDSVYSNLREDGNLTGKTLLPTHPDCFFHHLDRLPLELWTDDEAVVVACLWLLYSSGGPNRIESANGYQLTLDNVADNFRTMREVYAEADPDLRVAEIPHGSPPAAVLSAGAAQLAVARAALVSARRLCYEINATTRRKAEQALPLLSGPSPQEKGICESLSGLLPHGAAEFGGILAQLREDPKWLYRPRDDFPTGFEALIHATVAASVELFDAHFAMSRGVRSLPKLIEALGRQDWKEIVSWELDKFYCCVVPDRRAAAIHGGSLVKVADAAWAMAARMQYNTWHVMPGNLPKDPAVQARDFLAPHVLPDTAVFSDLHHRGHVANNIRFSARSPEPVMVAGFLFKSLTDLRVLRCEGPPFTQVELAAVAQVAAFLAQVSELVATAAQDGVPIEVTSFDHRWHRKTIVDNAQENHV
jgi:hypothetical protein